MRVEMAWTTSKLILFKNNLAACLFRFNICLLSHVNDFFGNKKNASFFSFCMQRNQFLRKAEYLSGPWVKLFSAHIFHSLATAVFGSWIGNVESGSEIGTHQIHVGIVVVRAFRQWLNVYILCNNSPTKANISRLEKPAWSSSKQTPQNHQFSRIKFVSEIISSEVANKAVCFSSVDRTYSWVRFGPLELDLPDNVAIRWKRFSNLKESHSYRIQLRFQHI